jgi:hypothetical protein
MVIHYTKFQKYGKINLSQSYSISMLFQDFHDKMHVNDIIKWGVFDGFLVGLFIAIFTIIHAKREIIIASAGGWELSASLFLIVLVSLSGLITSIIIFARPIYCLMNKQYRDSFLTIGVSILTIMIMTAFVLWSAPWFTL